MTTPSKVTSPRRTRKTKYKPLAKNVVANIVFLTHEYRERRTISEWRFAYSEYLNSLSSNELNIVVNCMTFTRANPIDKEKSQKPCPIIPFPIGGKRGVQIVKEA